MLNIIIIWIITILISMGIDISNDLKIIKDSADRGYRYNLDVIYILFDKLKQSKFKSKSIENIIPILNIYRALERREEYEKFYPIIFNKAIEFDVLDVMSLIEIDEYKKNPTGLNAFLINTKLRLQLHNATLINIENPNNNLKGSMLFRIGDDLSKIKIIQFSKSLSHLSIDKMQNIVADLLITASLNKICKDHNISLNLEEIIKKNTSFNDNHELTIQEKEEIYEKVKNEIISLSQNQNKGKTKIKK